MKVFNCILGILTVLASIYCIFYPGLTFLNIGWIVTIILGLWGISTIVSYAASRNDGNNKEKALMGTLGLIAGIAAAVVSALAMYINPCNFCGMAYCRRNLLYSNIIQG